MNARHGGLESSEGVFGLDDGGLIDGMASQIDDMIRDADRMQRAADLGAREWRPSRFDQTRGTPEGSRTYSRVRSSEEKNLGGTRKSYYSESVTYYGSGMGESESFTSFPRARCARVSLWRDLTQHPSHTHPGADPFARSRGAEASIGVVPSIAALGAVAAYAAVTSRFAARFHRTSFRPGSQKWLVAAWPVLYVASARFREEWKKAMRSSDDDEHA